MSLTSYLAAPPRDLSQYFLAIAGVRYAHIPAISIEIPDY